MNEYYKDCNSEQDAFIRYVESGKQMDKRHVLSLLIDMYMDYCGISLTYRTVVYDFGEYATKKNSYL